MKANIKHKEMITWQLHEYDVQEHRQGQDEIWIYIAWLMNNMTAKVKLNSKQSGTTHWDRNIATGEGWFAPPPF